MTTVHTVEAIEAVVDVVVAVAVEAEVVNMALEVVAELGPTSLTQVTPTTLLVKPTRSPVAMTTKMPMRFFNKDRVRF